MVVTEIHARSSLTRNAKKILAFLEEKREKISPLLILTHDYPDPDALASAVALRYLAESGFGIQSRVVYGGIIGRTENRVMVQILKLPVHKLRPVDFKRYVHTVLVDTQPQFENNSFPKNRKATIIIDQHPPLDKPMADLTIVDEECGATCAILAKALLIRGGEIPVRVATALAYGILSDTLNLYRAPDEHVVDTYLDILPFCDMRALAKIQNPKRSKRFFSTLAKGIQNAMILRGLIVSHLGPVENPDLTAQVADFLLTYQGVHFSFCTGRYNGRLQVSLRASKPTLEAGKVLRDIFASRGEAGGHGGIAGGSFEVGAEDTSPIWDEMEKVLTENLARRLRIPKKSEFTYPFRPKVQGDSK